MPILPVTGLALLMMLAQAGATGNMTSSNFPDLPQRRPYYSELRSRDAAQDPFRFKKHPYYGDAAKRNQQQGGSLFHNGILDGQGYGFDLLARNYVPAGKSVPVPSLYHGDRWYGLYGGCRVEYDWDKSAQKYTTQGHCK